LSSKSPGFFPYGMPDRLAFSTVCIRHLFETSTSLGLFFPLKVKKMSPSLPIFS
jgi:hypothetical protein